MIKRTGIRGEPITIESETGLLLDGLLFEAPKPAAIVVHIHGSYGNFYHAQFLHTLTRKYIEHTISVLTVNTSAHDGFGEGYFANGDFAYVGGAVSNFASCVPDISAIVAFATQLSDRVILQGHSLGCDRILHYSIRRSARNDLILLAPCDSYELQRRWLKTETVEAQIARLRRDIGSAESDWISVNEYGLRQGPNWTYNLPVTRDAFLSIAEGPPFRLMNINSPADFKLSSHAAIYIGGQDALQTCPSEVMFDYLAARLGTTFRIFEQAGDHMLDGCEARVGDCLVKWILDTHPIAPPTDGRSKLQMP